MRLIYTTPTQVSGNRKPLPPALTVSTFHFLSKIQLLSVYLLLFLNFTGQIFAQTDTVTTKERPAANTPLKKKPKPRVVNPEISNKERYANRRVIPSKATNDKYSNGQLKEKGDTLNGLKEGDWILFDFTGKITAKEKYVKGIKEGEVLHYYENGQIKEKGNNSNGSYEGEVISYFNNGQVSFKRNYVNGGEEGEWIWYYKNGTIKKSVKYTNGKFNGDMLENYENGQLRIKASYLNGKLEGDWIKYFASGQEKRTGAYLNGKRNGEWISYLESGEVDDKVDYMLGMEGKAKAKKKK